jgi:hypothetical protein
MTERDKEKLTMTCPKCGARGVAEVSTSDSMYAKTGGFHVNQFPADFSLARDGGGYQHKTGVRHSCGAVFDL